MKPLKINKKMNNEHNCKNHARNAFRYLSLNISRYDQISNMSIICDPCVRPTSIITVITIPATKNVLIRLDFSPSIEIVISKDV